MITTIAIAISGALGAMARFRLNDLIQARAPGPLPLGTLVINVMGSLLLGLLVGLRLNHGLPDAVELAAGVGFCGAFTTFSTLMYEVLRLSQGRAYRDAALTMSLNVVLGSFAAALGLLLTGAL